MKLLKKHYHLFNLNVIEFSLSFDGIEGNNSKVFFYLIDEKRNKTQNIQTIF